MGPQWPYEHVQMSHLQQQSWRNPNRLSSPVDFKQSNHQPSSSSYTPASSSGLRGGGGSGSTSNRFRQHNYNNKQNNILVTSNSAKSSSTSKHFRPYGNSQRPSTPRSFSFKSSASLKTDKRLLGRGSIPAIQVVNNNNQVEPNLDEQQHICQLHNDTLVRCLEKNGVYVCKSYGPRCFIIQKVSPSKVFQLSCLFVFLLQKVTVKIYYMITHVPGSHSALDIVSCPVSCIRFSTFGLLRRQSGKSVAALGAVYLTYKKILKRGLK